jgi:predicted metalloprotease with PDZ domain
LLWRQWKRASDYRGIAEDEFTIAAEQSSGLVLAPLIREWTEGTRDPDFARLLKPFGIEAVQRPAVDSVVLALLGVQLAPGIDCRLAHVHDGTPAQAAGLSAGDVVIAVGGLRATPGNFDKLLLRYAPGDQVELVGFRRDELMRTDVVLAQRPPLKTTLVTDPGAKTAAVRLRRGWLGHS